MTKTTKLDQLPIDMTKVPLFFGVGLESVSVYLEHCRTITVAAGNVLISPQRSHQQLYILLTGKLSVLLNETQTDVLTELNPGDCAGEMSLIENAPASAYVVASTNCTLLEIDEPTMWHMINSSHGIARNLLLILCQRLRFDNQHIVNSDSIFEQYQRNSVTDALTDLKNRHWMQEHFSRKIDRAKTAAASLCIAMLDLDNFRIFNDKYGHQQGDLILQTIASGLRRLFRPTDLIARFGGDEFVILLPDTNLENACEIGERARLGLQSDLHRQTGSSHRLSVSVGVAELVKADSLDSLLDRADKALYRAKNLGRNQVSP